MGMDSLCEGHHVPLHINVSVSICQIKAEEICNNVYLYLRLAFKAVVREKQLVKIFHFYVYRKFISRKLLI